MGAQRCHGNHVLARMLKQTLNCRKTLSISGLWGVRWPILIVSARDSGSSGSGSTPGLSNFIIFLGKILYFHYGQGCNPPMDKHPIQKEAGMLTLIYLLCSCECSIRPHNNNWHPSRSFASCSASLVQPRSFRSASTVLLHETSVWRAFFCLQRFK